MKATRDWFGEALTNIGKIHNNVVVVNCDLGSALRATGFKSAYKDRFFECGIAEANAISIAAGMAQEGFRPFVLSFGHFLIGKYLEVFQSVGLNNTGVVLVGGHAGLAIGKDGPTQMGLRDLALMRTLHNIEILHPIDGVETFQMMDYLASHSRPSFIRICRQPTSEVHDKNYQFKFGKPDVIQKTNNSYTTIFSMGGIVPSLVQCLKDFPVNIVNVSSLPIEKTQMLHILEKTKHALVIEDHFIKGGLADEIARLILEFNKNIRFDSWGIYDYAQAGDPKDLYERYKLDENGIVDIVQKFLKKKPLW